MPPIARRVPALRFDRRPAVGQPKRRRGVAAVGHEFEPLAVGDERARDAHRLQQHLMRRPFVVEREACAVVADGVNAGDQTVFAGVGARAVRPLPVPIVGRMRRVLRKGVQDIGQHQLLMLLLVMQPDLDDREDPLGVLRRFDQLRHRRIDMRAVGRASRRRPGA